MEQLNYNLLFRWFVGLSVDDPVWVPTVFSKNRDRLLEGDIAAAFMDAVLNLPRVKALLSDEHFSVDGTLIQAWASMKSFRRKDGIDEPPGPGATANATSTRRSARTRRMPRPPILMRGWPASRMAQEAKLAFTGHLLMENRFGLVVDARATQATGTAEPEAALAMLAALPGSSRKTVGADKNYDTAEFVAAVRGDDHHAACGTEHQRTSRLEHRWADDAPSRLRDQPGHPQTDRGGERLDQEGGRHGANQAAWGGAGGVDVSVQGRSLQPCPAAATAGDRMSLSGICRKAASAALRHREIAENRREIRKSAANTSNFDFEGAFSAAC